MSAFREIKSRINSYLIDSNLIQQMDKILIAVSGGMDSIFLLHLLIDLREELNLEIAVGHINHNIRNSSNIDENFVYNVCTNLDIPVYCKSLNYSAKGIGENIEAWAREGRYNELEIIRNEIQFDKIATAHHSNDQIETILQRISEKSGISGLRGIHKQVGNVIRPILSISRKEIETVVNELNIKYIDDPTNQDIKLKRNYFRHQVIPNWEELYPNLGEAVQFVSVSVYENDIILNYFFKELENRIVNKSNDPEVKIDIDKFDILPNEVKISFFSYLLSRKSWRRHQWNELERIILNAKTSKIYELDGFEILKDRNEWIIRHKFNADLKPININYNESVSYGKINFKIQDVKEVSINNDSNLEFIDKEKIRDKILILRQWQDGDIFQPIGMKGKKKVSEFLTNMKLSRFDKENKIVLTADNEIIWICGHRLSETVKIDNNTEQYLELSIKTNVG